MSTTFFTSDAHFGHRRICELAERPFPLGVDGVQQMNDALIDAWNQAVAPEDTVWMLGDYAMGLIVESLPIIERLNGSVTLIPGNHDRCWPGNISKKVDEAKILRWTGAYLDAGFASVVDPCDLEPGISMSHFPFYGDSNLEDRYSDHRPKDDGQWLIHGHVHGSWRQRDRMINVGVDAWAGRPVPLDTIRELISEGPQTLDPLEWK